MENEPKASCEYAPSPQERELTDDNVLLTICEDSVESREFISPAGGRNDLPAVLSYRLMSKVKSEDDARNGLSDCFHRTTTIPVQLQNNCELFVVKEYARSINGAPVNQAQPRIVTRLIAPKLSDTEGSPFMEPFNRRADRRRATHNEVERRRRDKINCWIYKLKELIPESEVINHADLKYRTQNGSDSKSQILIRACEYIKEMQEELRSLRECLMENDNSRVKNQQLTIEVDQLKTSTPLSMDTLIKLEIGERSD